MTAANPISELLEFLSVSDIQQKSDQELERLQDLLNAVQVQLLYVFTEPLVDRIEPFLARLRRAGSVVGRGGQNKLTQEPSYYLGQLHAMSGLAEMVQHQKIPRNAAEVLITRGDAQSIARIVFEKGSIGLTQLATELGKSTQNLHIVLQEMQNANLLRRDQLGRNVLYSPTPLTRTAVHWDAVQVEPATTVAAGWA